MVELNATKGVPAQSARPTGVLRNPNRPIRAVSSYRLLRDGKAYSTRLFHIIIHIILHNIYHTFIWFFMQLSITIMYYILYYIMFCFCCSFYTVFIVFHAWFWSCFKRRRCLAVCFCTVFAMSWGCPAFSFGAVPFYVLVLACIISGFCDAFSFAAVLFHFSYRYSMFCFCPFACYIAVFLWPCLYERIPFACIRNF